MCLQDQSTALPMRRNIFRVCVPVSCLASFGQTQQSALIYLSDLLLTALLPTGCSGRKRAEEKAGASNEGEATR